MPRKPSWGWIAMAATATLLHAVHRVACRVATAVPPRCRLAALYALLVALWVANARTIARAAERCLGVGGCSPLDDLECRLYIEIPLVAAAGSLLLLRAIWRREADAWEDWVAAQDDALPSPQGPALEEPRRLAHPLVSESIRERDFGDELVVCCFTLSFASMGVIYLPYSWIVRLALRRPPAHGTYLFTRIVCLGTAFNSCFLIIPYTIIRLRRFQMEMGSRGTAKA